MRKWMEYFISAMELEEEDEFEDEIIEPQKKFPWFMVGKVILLCAALLVCLFWLRKAPLQVLEGETPGSYSLSLEAGCLPAVWLMLFTTLVHSAFPLFFHWKKIYQRLLWSAGLPVLFLFFMPTTLVKQTYTATVLFCREFDKQPTPLHFLSELYDYNAWYMEAMDALFFVELALFALYYIAVIKESD